MRKCIKANRRRENSFASTWMECNNKRPTDRHWISLCNWHKWSWVASEFSIENGFHSGSFCSTWRHSMKKHLTMSRWRGQWFPTVDLKFLQKCRKGGNKRRQQKICQSNSEYQNQTNTKRSENTLADEGLKIRDENDEEYFDAEKFVPHEKLCAPIHLYMQLSKQNNEFYDANRCR